MQLRNRPKLVIVFLIAVFLVMLGVALYAPAYITSYSSQNSTSLTVTPISYLHVNTGQSSSTIPSVNYTGIFYVQHVCVYHQ